MWIILPNLQILCGSDKQSTADGAVITHSWFLFNQTSCSQETPAQPFNIKAFIKSLRLSKGKQAWSKKATTLSECLFDLKDKPHISTTFSAWKFNFFFSSGCCLSFISHLKARVMKVSGDPNEKCAFKLMLNESWRSKT